LIGLQLPHVLANIKEHSFATLLWYGSIISVAAIVARIIWVFPAAYIPRWISKRIRNKEPRPPISNVAIVAWSGMRGVVSLAAALALPLTIGNKLAFPNRDLIIFLTFAVIFSTLCIQGMTLPSLIKKLGVKPDDGGQELEDQARFAIATSLIEHIEENYSLGLQDEILNRIKSKYELRIQRLNKDASLNKLTEEQLLEFLSIQRKLLQQERVFLEDLRKQGKLGAGPLRKIEYELDLEESRLALEFK